MIGIREDYSVTIGCNPEKGLFSYSIAADSMEDAIVEAVERWLHTQGWVVTAFIASPVYPCPRDFLEYDDGHGKEDKVQGFENMFQKLCSSSFKHDSLRARSKVSA